VCYKAINVIVKQGLYTYKRLKGSKDNYRLYKEYKAIIIKYRIVLLVIFIINKTFFNNSNLNIILLSFLYYNLY
jgi:hypothetical protein